MAGFIGDLLVRLGVEATGVRQGLDSAAREFQQFEQRTAQALRGANLLPDLDKQGRKAANDLIRSLGDTFRQRKADISEQLLLGLIKPADAERETRKAGRAMQRGLLAGMAELGSRGMLSPALAQKLTAEAAKLGLPAGQQTAESIAAGIESRRGEISRTIDQSLADGFRGAEQQAAEAGRKAQQAFANQIRQVGATMRQTGDALTVGVTAPILAIGGASLRAAMTFEQSFAGVRKTVEGTQAEFEALERDITRLSELPGRPGADQLAGIAQMGGQLGVATSQLDEFISTVSDLRIAADSLSMEEAATGLARLSKLTGTSQQEFSNLGSALVAVGNNFAATEQEILNLSLMLAGTASAFGASAGQIIGFSGALREVGLRAELGGSSMQRILLQVGAAARNGGSELERFAAIAGMSGSQFRRAFKDDALGAITSLIEGLGRVQRAGGDVARVLEGLGVNDIETTRALLSAAQAGDRFRTAIQLGSRAFQENAALAREASIFYNTLGSDLAAAYNATRNLAKEFGDTLAPAARDALGAARELLDVIRPMVQAFGELPQPVRQAAIAMAAMTAALGPVISLAGRALELRLLAGIFARVGVAARGAGVAAGAAGAAGGFAALGAKLAAGGPLLIGLGLLVAAFYASGRAAREAKQQAAEFSATLGTLSGQQLAAEAGRIQTALRQAVQERERLRAAAAAEPVQLSGTAGLPMMSRTQRQFNAAAAEVERLGGQLEEVNAQLHAVARSGATAAGVIEDLGAPDLSAFGDDAEKMKKALTELGRRAGSVAQSYRATAAAGGDIAPILAEALRIQTRAAQVAATQRDRFGEIATSARQIVTELQAITMPSLTFDPATIAAMLKQLGDVGTALRRLGIDAPALKIHADTTAAHRELVNLRVALQDLQREGVLLRPEMEDIGPAVETLRQALRDAELGIPVNTDSIRTAIADIQSHLSRADLSTEVQTRMADIRLLLSDAQRVLDGAPVFLRVELPPEGPVLPPDVMRQLERQIQGLQPRIPVTLDVVGLDGLTTAAMRFGTDITAGATTASDILQEGSRKAADTLRGAFTPSVRAPGTPGGRPEPSKNATEAAAARAEAVRAFNEQVQAVQETISAFGDLADATGFLSEGLARGLRGAETVLSGIGRIKAADELKGLGRTAAEVSGALSIAAGVLQVVVGHFEARAAAEAEARRQAYATARALADLRQSAAGFSLSAATYTRALEAAGKISVPGPAGLLLFNKWAQETGYTMAELARVGRELGIEIVNAQGEIDFSKVEAFTEAVRIAREALTRFTQGMADQRQLQDARRQIFDITDPWQSVKDEIALLGRYAPSLTELYGLDQIDVDTAEARAELERITRQIFEDIEAGKIPAELLAQLPEGVRTLLESVLNLDRLTDSSKDAADALNGMAATFRNIPDIGLATLRIFQTARDAAERRTLTELPPEATQPRVPRERAEVEAQVGALGRVLQEGATRFTAASDVAQTGMESLRASADPLTVSFGAVDAAVQSAAASLDRFAALDIPAPDRALIEAPELQGFTEADRQATRTAAALGTLEVALGRLAALTVPAPDVEAIRAPQLVGFDAASTEAIRTAAALSVLQTALLDVAASLAAVTAPAIPAPDVPAIRLLELVGFDVANAEATRTAAALVVLEGALQNAAALLDRFAARELPTPDVDAVRVVAPVELAPIDLTAVVADFLRAALAALPDLGGTAEAVPGLAALRAESEGLTVSFGTIDDAVQRAAASLDRFAGLDIPTPDVPAVPVPDFTGFADAAAQAVRTTDALTTLEAGLLGVSARLAALTLAAPELPAIVAPDMAGFEAANTQATGTADALSVLTAALEGAAGALARFAALEIAAPEVPPIPVPPAPPAPAPALDAARIAADFLQAVLNALPDFAGTDEAARDLDRLRAEFGRTAEGATRAGAALSAVEQDAARLTMSFGAIDTAIQAAAASLDRFAALTIPVPDVPPIELPELRGFAEAGDEAARSATALAAFVDAVEASAGRYTANFGAVDIAVQNVAAALDAGVQGVTAMLERFAAIQIPVPEVPPIRMPAVTGFDAVSAEAAHTAAALTIFEAGLQDAALRLGAFIASLPAADAPAPAQQAAPAPARNERETVRETAAEAQPIVVHNDNRVVLPAGAIVIQGTGLDAEEIGRQVITQLKDRASQVAAATGNASTRELAINLKRL